MLAREGVGGEAEAAGERGLTLPDHGLPARRATVQRRIEDKQDACWPQHPEGFTQCHEVVGGIVQRRVEYKEVYEPGREG